VSCGCLSNGSPINISLSFHMSTCLSDVVLLSVWTPRCSVSAKFKVECTDDRMTVRYVTSVPHLIPPRRAPKAGLLIDVVHFHTFQFTWRPFSFNIAVPY
jgi:hypothetical protein